MAKELPSSDDDRPSLNVLLDRAADLQQQYERDFEQANPYDAAERDAAAYLCRHDNVLGLRLAFQRRTVYLRKSGDNIVLVTAGDGGLIRRIPVDAPGDR